MTAKKMFEELGYKLNEKHKEVVLEYQNYGNGNEILFWSILKGIAKNAITTSDVSEVITPLELKAIQKQIEELGWK